jgi:hypothetical protein
VDRTEATNVYRGIEDAKKASSARPRLMKFEAATPEAA